MSRKFRERAGRVVAAECALCSEAEGGPVLRPVADFQRDSNGPLGVQARCRGCRRGAARTRNGRIRRMLHDARWNAARAGRRCTIGYEDVDRVFGDRCAVTGLPFDMGVTVVDGRLRNHNAPSLDRRDATVGYVAGNIQVVLAWVNQAKGKGTQRQFKRRLRLGAVKQARHVERWQRPPQGVALRSVIG